MDRPPQLECPDCLELIDVREDQLGQAIKCPRCRRDIEVPAELPVSTDEAEGSVSPAALFDGSARSIHAPRGFEHRKRVSLRAALFGRGADATVDQRKSRVFLLAILAVLVPILAIILVIFLRGVQEEYEYAFAVAQNSETPEYAVTALEEVLEKYPYSGYARQARGLRSGILERLEKQRAALGLSMDQARKVFQDGRSDEALAILNAGLKEYAHASNRDEARRLHSEMEEQKRALLSVRPAGVAPEGPAVPPVKPGSTGVETPVASSAVAPGVSRASPAGAETVWPGSVSGRSAGVTGPVVSPASPTPGPDLEPASVSEPAVTSSVARSTVGKPEGPSRGGAGYAMAYVPKAYIPIPTRYVRSVVGTFRTRRDAMWNQHLLQKKQNPVDRKVGYEVEWNSETKVWTVVAVQEIKP